MQNREELRKKGHDGRPKPTCRERGKKYNFQKGGGGDNYHFRRVAEPKLFHAAPAPTIKKFQIRLRSRNRLGLQLQLEPVEMTQFKL